MAVRVVVPAVPLAAVPPVIVPVPMVVAIVVALLRLAVIPAPTIISVVRLEDTAAEQDAEREQAAQP